MVQVFERFEELLQQRQVTMIRRQVPNTFSFQTADNASIENA